MIYSFPNQLFENHKRNILFAKKCQVPLNTCVKQTPPELLRMHPNDPGHLFDVILPPCAVDLRGGSRMAKSTITPCVLCYVTPYGLRLLLIRFSHDGRETALLSCYRNMPE
ncbi:hypothetical protein CDAR_175821 [Caerostris darwini]|uniref:Uncharacterized protein n=1 Tax=Caerostris darwini TaxID=1538125 RepID=A0AAV4VH08_9ARAC|nr:hypothetical protein CDAR_175821 [Caerostris darwini]